MTPGNLGEDLVTPGNQEPPDTSKQPIRTRCLGHVTGYQPISDQYFLIWSVPDAHHRFFLVVFFYCQKYHSYVSVNNLLQFLTHIFLFHNPTNGRQNSDAT